MIRMSVKLQGLGCVLAASRHFLALKPEITYAFLGLALAFAA
jgi:hypothetical protein